MHSSVAAFYASGISCRVHAFGALQGATAAPLFVMPFFGEPDDLLSGQHERLDGLVADGHARPFALCTLNMPDWENALSPWPAPPMTPGHAGFSGGAAHTLRIVREDVLPAAQGAVPAVRGGPRGILGYSMAGLFALWAVHETDTFAVCASCSGSLWYEGFTAYLAARAPKGPCAAYLSLGQREEHARHPLFRQVGEATRQAAACMASSALVWAHDLVWHPGGHTGHVGERIAAAQLWMNKHCAKPP